MTELEEDDYKSKTQVKQEVHALRDLGKFLAELPDPVRKKYDLPESLESSIVDYRRFTSNGARKRQLQYIGKVMRDIDTSVIEEMIKKSQLQAATDNRDFQLLEQLRDNLVAGEPGVFDKLIEDHPAVDIQHLRQLMRASQKEAKNNKPPTSSRKLFQYLRELILEKNSPKT